MTTELDAIGCPYGQYNLVGTVCVQDGASSTDVDYVNFEDPNWFCKGRDDAKAEDHTAAVILWVVVNLVFGVGWIPLAACCCCYFRNKSQNKAPFNGGGVQSFPQAAKAQNSQMQVVQMQCPEGSAPGQTLQTNVNGQMLDVQIPAGVAPGAMFQVSPVA